ncbi:hypothetical protein OAC78_04935 [Litorivicinus sp.]|nr:hypothetical protein [Litorivicinus sp.]
MSWSVMHHSNYVTNQEPKGSLPYSIIGVDRQFCDYSLQSGKFRKRKTFYDAVKVGEEIQRLDPRLVVSHVSDNGFSHLVTLICKRIGIPACALSVCPFWPGRQYLLDPLRMLPLNMQSIGKYLQVDKRLNSSEPTFCPQLSISKYNKISKFWGRGFRFNRNIFGILKDFFIALKRYRFQFILGLLISWNKKTKHYSQCINSASECRKFLLALHMQPEAMLLCGDNRFADSANLCEWISYNMPLDAAMVVKEHPAQFFRTLSFHNRLSALPNVVYYSGVSGVSEILEDFEIVFVVSGNAGFEALQRGLKVVIFDEAFFSGCPNVYTFDFNVRLDDFLAHVIEQPIQPLSHVNDWMASYELWLYDNSVAVSEQDLIGKSFETGIKRLEALYEIYQVI